MDPQPRGPDWMQITPKAGSLFHANSHFERETATVAGQHHIGRLIEQCAEPSVTAFGDAAGVIDLAGLITPRDQAQISAYVARTSEATGVIDRGCEGQCG